MFIWSLYPTNRIWVIRFLGFPQFFDLSMIPACQVLEMQILITYEQEYT